MSNDTVIKVTLDTNGTLVQGEKEAGALNSQLVRMAANANNASRAMKAAKARSSQPSDLDEYGQARAGGGTGAAGRDFANQARGLGGLVRVYATFAANIFAVSAAFNALSRAADTTNLVAGLDQLGAASGRNLGGLSQKIVEVTDNAVSLREAMTATAQASAAGMSSKDILRLAQGAKSASQALGIDMTDALSRISRGVTKLEPELLDELGIFVRVDKAAEDYARTIGKSAASLTDFEKRAAFAAAVLTQVEQKFGALNIPANPYTQLLASLKNVSTKGLELINNVLGPIAALLAKSPTGLAIAIAGVAGILIKQALPAIGEFRSNMRAAANEATEKAKNINQVFEAFKQSKIADIQSKLSQEVQNQAKVAENAIKQARAQLDASAVTKFKSVKEITGTAIGDVSKAQLAALDARKKALGEELASGKGTEARNTLLKTQIADFDALTTKIRTAQAELAKFDKMADPEYRQLVQKTSPLSHEAQIARIQDRLIASSRKTTILSNAAENAADIGMRDSWAILRKEVGSTENKFGGFTKAVLLARGGLTILSTAMMTALSAFSGWAAIIGLVVTGITLLVGWMSKNTKESQAATSALDTLKESSDNVARTLDVISKKDPLAKFSVESVTAKANAMEDLVTSALDAVDKVEKEIAARGTSDKITNSLWSIIGKGTEDKLSKQISQVLLDAVKLSSTSLVVPKDITTLSKLLNIDSNSSLEEVSRAIEKSGLSVSELMAKLKAANIETKLTAGNLKDLADAYSNSARSLREYIASQVPKDPQAKIALEGIVNLDKLNAAIKEPLKNLPALVTLMTDVNQIALFPSSSRDNVVKFGAELESAQKQLVNTKLRLEQLIQQSKELKEGEITIDRSKLPKSKSFADAPEVANKADELRREAQRQRGEDIKSNDAQIKALTSSYAVIKANIESASATFASNLSKVFNAESKNLERALGSAFAQAGITVQKAYASILGESTAGIDEKVRLEKASINIQANTIKYNIELIKSLKEASISVDELAIQMWKANADARDMGLIAAKEKVVEGKKKVLSSSNSMKDLTELGIKARGGDEVAKEVYNSMRDFSATLISAQGQLAGINAQGQAAGVAGEYQKIDLVYNRKNEILDIENKSIAANKALLNLQKQSNIISEAEYYTRELELNLLEEANNEIKDRNILLAKQTKIALGYDNAPAGKAGDAMRDAYLEDWLAIQDKLDERAKVSLKNQVVLSAAANQSIYASIRKQQEDNISYQAELESRKRQTNGELTNVSMEQSLLVNNAAMEQLNILNSQGKFTEDIYNSKKKTLELEANLLAYEQKKLSLQQEAANKLAELSKERKLALSADEVNVVLLLDIKDREQAVNDILAARLGLLDRENTLKGKSLDLTYSMNEKTRKTEEIFTSAIDRMSDAIIDFGLTGKQSFGDMIKSMIMDLIKLEMRMSMQAAWKGIGGFSGLMDIFKGGSGSNLSNSTSLVGGTGADYIIPGTFAKGGMFDNGVQKFARGGMFTNSVVSSPTLFKFAKGTGMMGEAGPEAIMPLKRGPNGSLGVSGTGGSTHVVVNNYSKEQATAKETVDSRGNTRVEVTIGDMVAGEVQRIGSAAQQSIRNTFGKQPVLIRR